MNEIENEVNDHDHDKYITTQELNKSISEDFDAKLKQAKLASKNIGKQVRHLPLFHLFSVIDVFKWFSIGSLRKNIQLKLEFLKGPFLFLHFFYSILMTFLMVLSVILLSILMILLSTLIVIRYLICGNIQNWLLNLNLVYKTTWTGAGNDLLISILEKLILFRLTGLITLMLSM